MDAHLILLIVLEAAFLAWNRPFALLVVEGPVAVEELLPTESALASGLGEAGALTLMVFSKVFTLNLEQAVRAVNVKVLAGLNMSHNFLQEVLHVDLLLEA